VLCPKIGFIFWFEKSKALKNRSLIKGGLLGGEAPNIIMGNKKRNFENRVGGLKEFINKINFKIIKLYDREKF